MSKPSEYLMTEKIVAMIEAAKPSLHMLRLFHACYAYVDRDPFLHIGIVAMTDKPACTALCSDLTAITGSPSAKSNAWIKEAIETCDDRALFSRLTLDTGGRAVTFKFASRVQPASLRGKKTPFAMVDGDEIATISSAPEALFYTRAIMVAGADQPSFYLPNMDAGMMPWSHDAKKSWLRIAARVGERLDQHYVVLPEHDPLTRKIVRVRVKVVTRYSKWSPECLYPRRSVASVSVVHDGKQRSLAKNELLRRRTWTQVVEP